MSAYRLSILAAFRENDGQLTEAQLATPEVGGRFWRGEIHRMRKAGYRIGYVIRDGQEVYYLEGVPELDAGRDGAYEHDRSPVVAEAVTPGRVVSPDVGPVPLFRLDPEPASPYDIEAHEAA